MPVDPLPLRSEPRATENGPAPVDAPVEVLETGVRLSESMLWRLQEEYYSQRGLDAWDSVPFHATSSAYACDTYAEMILSFLLDYAPHLDLEAPLWVIELGAGTGCFSWRTLRALNAKRAGFRALANLDLRYVMSDFTSSIVRSWRRNPYLKPLMDDGPLDLGVYRPEESPALELQLSRRSLSARDFRNPAIVIANYLFDTLRHDAFRVDHGTLYEVRCELSQAARPSRRRRRVSLERLRYAESLRPLTSSDYYDDPDWNALLEHYRTEMPEASVIIPLGGLHTIRNLRRLTGDNLALFVMDKGYGYASQLEGLWPQEYACHGSVSFMVNFHALTRYVESAGGQVLSDNGHGFDLAVTMNTILARQTDLEHARHFFSDILRLRDPLNAVSYVHTTLNRHRPTPASSEWVNSVLSVLQTCACDPSAFASCAPHLEAAREELDEDQTATLRQCLDRVRDNLFVTDREPEVLGPLARLYHRLQEYDRCIEVCESCLETMADEPWVVGYLARCHETKGRLDLALHYLRRYRRLDPDDAWGEEAFKRVRDHLAAEAAKKPAARRGTG